MEKAKPDGRSVEKPVHTGVLRLDRLEGPDDQSGDESGRAEEA